MPKCSDAVSLAHSMRDWLSSNITPLGDAWMAARNSSRRAWLSLALPFSAFCNLRMRSTSCPHPLATLGSFAQSSARSQFTTRWKRQLSIASQTMAPAMPPSDTQNTESAYHPYNAPSAIRPSRPTNRPVMRQNCPPRQPAFVAGLTRTSGNRLRARFQSGLPPHPVLHAGV